MIGVEVREKVRLKQRGETKKKNSNKQQRVKRVCDYSVTPSPLLYTGFAVGRVNRICSWKSKPDLQLEE